MTVRRRPWTAAECAVLRTRYPHENTVVIARDLGRDIRTVYAKAAEMGLSKTPERLAEARWREKGRHHSPATEWKRGHVAWNKGKHFSAGGRSPETRFKKGRFPHNRDPDYYVIGALRVNADGYIDMRISFEHGSRGWRGLHRILWEDAHGPVPAGHSVCFKNGDKLDCELANLELVPRHELMRRNSIHNFPEPIAKAVLLRGALVRAINRKTRRGKTTPD